MIQRIQSIWLLLAAVFAALTFRFPFYSGQMVIDPATHATSHADLNANTTVGLTILTVLAGAIAFADIFLFRNRTMQLRIAYLGMVATIALIAVYILAIEHFVSGSSNLALSCILPFMILLFYILAARGIWKDQRLVRSMDRLR